MPFGARKVRGIPFGLAILAMALCAEAATPCSSVVGELVSLEGQAEVQHAQDKRWQPVALGASICQQDTIRVGVRS